MRLTPLDIRKQEFSRGFRGYDAEEVHAFLQMVSNQWEELLDDSRRKDEKIRELESKMEHYEKVEEALQEALHTARESSRKALENAEQRARLVVDQAEARAEDIKRDAEHERHQIKREAAKLSSRRSEIVTRLRAFLMSEMELLARYEGDDPVGFIKLLPAERERLRRLSGRLEGESDEGTELSIDEEGAERYTPAPAATSPDEHHKPEEEAESLAPPAPEYLEMTPEPAESEPTLQTPAAHAAPSEPERHVHDWTRPESQEHHPPAAAQREAHEHHPRHAPPPEAYEHQPQDAVHPEAREQHVEGRMDPEGDEGASAGPGWTTHTVVSRPSEQAPQQGPRREERRPESEREDNFRTRASSEEIEKIRRILSDLD